MVQQNKSKNSDYFPVKKIIEIGVGAGFFLFLMGWLLHTFHFMKWTPMLASFMPSSKGMKIVIAALLVLFLSIVLSSLYYALLRKRKPFLSGIVISVFLFLCLVLFTDREALYLVTLYALLSVYSLFISMSVSWWYEQSK